MQENFASCRMQGDKDSKKILMKLLTNTITRKLGSSFSTKKQGRQITYFPMPLGIRLGVDLGGVKSKTEDLVLLRRELAGLTNSIESRQCTWK